MPSVRLTDTPRRHSAGRGALCSLVLHGLALFLLMIADRNQMPVPVPPATPVEPVAIDLLEAGDAHPAAQTMSAVRPTAERLAPRPASGRRTAAAPSRTRQPGSASPQPAVERPTDVQATDGEVKDGTQKGVDDRSGDAAGRHGSESVQDFIRAQIVHHWDFDVRILGNAEIVVTLHLVIDPDGGVRTVDIVDDPGATPGQAYRVVADSARRAALVAAPLRIPDGRYADVADLVLTFNTRALAR